MILCLFACAGDAGDGSRTLAQSLPELTAEPRETAARAENWRALPVEVHASATRVVVVVVPERDDRPMLAGAATITASDGSKINARLVHVRMRGTAGAARLSAWLGVGGEPEIIDQGPMARDRDVAADAAVPTQGVQASLLIIEAGPAALRGATPSLPLTVVEGDLDPGRDELMRAARRAAELLPEGETSRRELERELNAATFVPATAWRAQALLEALRRTAVGGGGLSPGRTRDRLAMGVVELVSEQEELLWLAALSRLAALDRELSGRVCDALLRVGRIGVDDREAMLPVWAADRRELSVLRDRLNAPEVTPAERLSVASGFVDRQPDAVAWVIDDAGAIDGSLGTPRGLLGVSAANLAGVRVRFSAIGEQSRGVLRGERRERGEATLPDNAAPGEGVMVEGGRSAVVPMVAPPTIEFDGDPMDRGAWARQGERQRVTLNDRTTELSQFSRALPVSPPGMLIGPMLRDWTLDSWRAGTPVSDPVAAALLLRDAQGRWCLLVEGIAPASALSGERVRVFFGPRSSPVAIIAVRSGVDAVDELRAQRLETTLGQEPVTAPNSPGEQAAAESGLIRWQATVVLPDAAMSERSVAIGVVHERTLPPERGVTATMLERWAWPRPMMPMQSEPGRVLVDLSAWPD